jgi:histidinol-phosphate phosphatase family protein
MIIIEHLFQVSQYKKVIFLDRDGVINVNRPNYVRLKSDIEIIKTAVDALIQFRNNNIGIIIITNQQAIGKNILSIEEAVGIHLEVIKKLNIKDNSIIASMICPHLESENCLCRKPGIKMIQTASEMFGVEMKNNFFIGDSLTDILAAKKADLTPICVGNSVDKKIPISSNALFFDDLLGVSNYICPQ